MHIQYASIYQNDCRVTIYQRDKHRCNCQCVRRFGRQFDEGSRCRYHSQVHGTRPSRCAFCTGPEFHFSGSRVWWVCWVLFVAGLHRLLFYSSVMSVYVWLIVFRWWDEHLKDALNLLVFLPHLLLVIMSGLDPHFIQICCPAHRS